MDDGKVHEIEMVGGVDGGRARITVSETASSCRLILAYRELRLEAEADDGFEAFCVVRRRLERENLMPRCYGASLNVFPSPMSRDMGGGWMAYRMTMGRPARLSDLVAIFDTGPDVVPATVEDQRRFFEAWADGTRS